ncbi:MAG TPA: TonB-dependent receptor [Candidatus Binatia bacterium]|nr:TonB-dependent receptor [Candidatus Binatia bacterium]
MNLPRRSYSHFSSVFFFLLSILIGYSAMAQETLGGINGEITDPSGAVVQGASVKARAVATNLMVTARTNGDGSFSIADLPIGTYEVTLTKEGFKTAVYPQIIVQGNRIATLNVQMKPGAVSSTVEVEATPLLNETDTTTGYVLNSQIIENSPLGTGSFTQLATLSPGVNAELLNTSGTNAGFGNQGIWANGQRDTSNSFSFNGINANNIFNGKSTSQVASSRVAVNIGESSAGGGEIQTSTSVYGAIGQALPTAPPETIQELHVNSAMYDASQGANSGAHIEVITKTGTNAIHGGAWEYYQTGGWNANPWFNENAGLPTPALHRNVFGGMVGGPIKKDKLFFFGSYQGQRVSDQLLGNSLVPVPAVNASFPGTESLTSDRSAATLANLVNADFDGGTPCGGFSRSCTAADMNPIALNIMNMKAPDGSYFIPNAATDPTQLANLQNQGGDAEIQGSPSRFTADQVNANLDYVFNSSDRLAGKYYFQRDPNVDEFASSYFAGFPQTMHAGSQVLSLDNTTILRPTLSWEQRLGFIREKAYASTNQFMTPSSVGITIPGTNLFPQMNIGDMDGNFNGTIIGPSNFANSGIFQNDFTGSTNLAWVRGHHTIQTGLNFDYAQLTVVNRDSNVARVNFADFAGFMTGSVCSFTNSCGFSASPAELFSGVSNRHFRSKQAGAFVLDNWRIRPNVTLNLGLRWDWDGPLVEKDGLLTNFYPKDYQYDVASDSFGNGGQAVGLVVAGNNSAFGTKGVSDSTLTGRQWGFAPRFGIVYSPSFVKNLVVRAGFGIYYDRGEYFSEFSQPAGGGTSGPFGVTMSEPFVVPNYAGPNATFALPFGTTAPPPPPSNLSGVTALIPNASQIINQTTTYCTNTGQFGCGGLFFAGYDPANKLPYSENWTVDFQWQPLNTWVVTLGYVGNHGVHEIIPLPFNQAQIATPQNPLLAGGPNEQIYSYGWQVPGVNAENVQTLVDGFNTGNAALRAPYIGYDPNSVSYQARGISNYDALQVGLNKRMSHGLLVTASYTYSHTLDEQSGLGLFFTGNDPNNLKSNYGSSDYDRTHVLSVSYLYQVPNVHATNAFLKQAVNGWGLNGVTTLESGQPYSVNDYSGSVASIYWGGGNDAITNPIVPVGGVGSTSSKAILQGTTGINALNPVLNAAAFGPPPLIAPGAQGVPPCDAVTGACDYFETGYTTGGRNIFRGPFQDRFDLGLFKTFKITERFTLRYDAQAFNIFNHPSFDIPNNSVQFVTNFENPPIYGPSSNTTPCEVLPTGPNIGPGDGAYLCPPKGHLGVIQHTIGSPRFLQMALHLTF